MSKERAVEYLMLAVEEMEMSNEQDEVIEELSTCNVRQFISALNKLQPSDQLHVRMAGKVMSVSSLRVTNHGELYIQFTDVKAPSMLKRIFGG